MHPASGSQGPRLDAPGPTASSFPAPASPPSAAAASTGTRKVRVLLPGSNLARHLTGQMSPLADDLVVAPGKRAFPAEVDPAQASKVARNAVVGMLSQGTCFGTVFALSNHLRAVGNPAVKVLAGFLPIAGGMLTAPAEEAVRDALQTRPTRPATPSLGHDAIPSAILFAVNAAYIRSTQLPRFPAHTLAGAAVTAGLSFAGTLLAGGATEAYAQHTRQRDPHPADPPPKPSVLQTAVGRGLSLMPMAAFNQVTAAFVTARGAVPPSLALGPIAVATGGWSLRRLLTPPNPAGHPPAPPVEGKSSPDAEGIR